MKAVHWGCKPFDELSPRELYRIIKLRNQVFVVEQNCVFQDADDKDPDSFHICGYVSTDLAAYARIVPAGISYPEISIGRVIVSRDYRKRGIGKALMLQAIHHCYRLFGKQPLKIGAQLYLKDFYQSFGFCQTSEMYLEDNIPHIEMTKL